MDTDARNCPKEPENCFSECESVGSCYVEQRKHFCKSSDMAYRTKVILMTLSDLKVIRLLQAFSNVIFRTGVQQLTRFQLTKCVAVPLRQRSFLLVFVIMPGSVEIFTVVRSNVSYTTLFALLSCLHLLYTQLTDTGKHVSLCLIPSHAGIKGNEMADKAAKEGISSVITQSKIPPEIFPHISKLCTKDCKIHATAPLQINCFQSNQYLAKTNRVLTSLCRRDETVIIRLRIGHSRMTHSYLLSRESQPVCDHCKCHLTVKHMLLECPSTAVIRHKYFSSTTLKELFSNVDARCILDFTKESGLY